MSVLHQDVLTLQCILGNHALSLNAEKTKFGSRQDDFEERELDEIKKTLLRKREAMSSYYDYDEDVWDESLEVDEEEKEYIQGLIGKRNVAEEDVELALPLVRDDAEIQMSLASLVLNNFPHLLKSLYAMVPTISGYDSELWDIVSSKLRRKVLTEYELFWLVRIALDHYSLSPSVVDFLFKVFDHPSSTPVVRAAILECEEMGHGLEELKVNSLRQEPVSLVGIACIAGLRKMGKGKRNQLYKYAAKASRHIALLCNVMSATEAS